MLAGKPRAGVLMQMGRGGVPNVGIGGASKQGAFSIRVGQQMYLHLGSFTQLEEAGYTNPNILTVEVQSGKNT